MPNCNLILGDCLEKMMDLPSGGIDLVLCDLPYGTTTCKWDSVLKFDDLWRSYERVGRLSCPIVLTSAQPFTSALIMSKPGWYKHDWIWIKNRGTNPMGAKYQPLKRHETIAVFSNGGGVVPYFPQMRKGKPYRAFSGKQGSTIGEVYGNSKSIHKGNPEGILYPVTVQEFACEFGLHPTQKPVALMEYLIKTYTNEGDTVLDNCMGSGTTGVACMNLNRNFVGIEKDPKYFEIASKRVEEARTESVRTLVIESKEDVLAEL